MRLNELNGADVQNFGESLTALAKLSSACIPAIELTDGLFAAAIERVGETVPLDQHQRVVHEWSESTGLAGDEALRMLEAALPVGDDDGETQRAQEAQARIIGYHIRLQLLLRLQRDSLFSMAELCRLRAHTCFVHVRLQIETAALIRVMAEELSCAREWMGTFDRTNGQEFHDKFHGRTMHYVGLWGLRDLYDEACGMSNHPRFMGSVPGSLLAEQDKPVSTASGITYIDIEDSTILMYWLFRIVGFHLELFRHFPHLFPELRARDLRLDELPRYAALHGQLRSDLEPRFEALRAQGFETAYLRPKES